MKASEKHRVELVDAIEESRARYEPELAEWLARLERRRADHDRKRREGLEDAAAILGQVMPLATTVELVVDGLHDHQLAALADALQRAVRDLAKTLGDRKAALPDTREPARDFRPEALPDRLVTPKG